MPRGVKLSPVDKLYNLATTMTVDEFITAVAEFYVVSMTDNSPAKLYEIFGEMMLRAQIMRADLATTERKKPGPKPKPKALAQIVAREATAPKKVRRTPRGQAGKPDTGKTIPRRKRAA